MFEKHQKELSPVRVVVSTTKEKPWDDIRDYPSDWG